MWLLDTNVWIAYLSKKPSPVKSRIAGMPENELWLCDVVKAELYYGAYKSARPDENLARLEMLFSILPSFSFDGDAALHFGSIRAQLARQGTPIGPYDLQIAAIARTHGVTLVTHNTGEFSRVPGLLLEDWEG
jgi:tRNA(fMet)-specific endonuclease VapC